MDHYKNLCIWFIFLIKYINFCFVDSYVFYKKSSEVLLDLLINA